MAHSIHSSVVDETNRLDPTCDDCAHKRVGELDSLHFRELMGCTRQQFENWCQWARHHEGASRFSDMPIGLYNFWYAIMDANALSVQNRRDELARREAQTVA